MAVKNLIKPLFDNVLIKPIEAESKTSSGIFLPDSAKERPQIGEVLAVGEGKVTPKGDKEPMIVKVGQKVLFRKTFNSSEAKFNGEELILVEQKDILAVIE